MIRLNCVSSSVCHSIVCLLPALLISRSVPSRALAQEPGIDAPSSLGSSGESTQAKRAKPNFVILFMDDGGYGDLSCYGHPTIRTPNLDQMAREGVRFTQFYSASPACTASRYGLLTGRLPARSGFAWVLVPKSKRGIHPSERTIAEVLKDRGYRTAAFGKWHLGNKKRFLPLQNGFDEYCGLPYSNDMRPPKWPPIPLMEGNEVKEFNPDQRKLTHLYAERAMEFIEMAGDDPFFVYVPFAMPHVPLYPGQSFAGSSSRGTYGDVIEEIDHEVGRILAFLRKKGLAKNTLVWFTSDNGPWIIKHERGGSAGLLRDGKGSTWEGGMREPGIVWWPGKIQAGRIERRVSSTLDILPTLAELAGAELPQDRSLDGISLSSWLVGSEEKGSAEKQSSQERAFFYYGPGNRLHAMRYGPWKLHIKTSSQTRKKYFGGKLPLLFQLEEDPSEQYDRSKEHPEIVERLQKMLEEHRKQIASEGSFFDKR